MVMKVYKYIRFDSNRHLFLPEHRIGDGFIMRKKMNERKRDGIKLVLKIQKKGHINESQFSITDDESNSQPAIRLRIESAQIHT